MYENGSSLETVGAAFAVTPGSVRHWLIKKGKRVRSSSEMMASKTPAHDKAQIVEWYMSGECLKTIQEKTGVSLHTIKKTIRDSGCDKSDRVMKWDWKRPEIVRLYKSGMPANEIHKKLKVCSKSIVSILQEEGVQRRTLSERNSRYSLNHQSFDEITPECAYWIGMLITDGCVSDANGGHKVILSLQIRDIGHLERFRGFIGSNRPIHKRKHKCPKGIEREYAVIIFDSERIVNRLADFGVVPRKTYTAKIIGLEGDPHFWRGAIDGDGGVYLRQNSDESNARPSLGFCGCGHLVDQFAVFCSHYLDGFVPTVGEKGKLKSIKYASSSAKTIVKILYPDGEYGLARKLEVANKIKSWTPLRIIKKTKTKCEYEGCGLLARSKHLCANHFTLAMIGTIDPAKLSKNAAESFKDIDFSSWMIRSRSTKGFTVCQFDGCSYRPNKFGLCNTHKRHMENGIIDKSKVSDDSLFLWNRWNMLGMPPMKKS
jgi:hypothetical protein